MTTPATTLMSNEHRGIKQHGIVEVEPGVGVYAYEVDGLGGMLADFDDPNRPSLLAVPLLLLLAADINFHLCVHLLPNITRKENES